MLVALVGQYKNTIESKKSGAFSWKQKEAVWKKLEKEFNCSNTATSYKDAKTLKTKYCNIKQITKAKFAENIKKIHKTGGGISSPVHFSDIDLAVKDLIGKQIDGLQSEFDSDADAIKGG